MIFNFFQRSTSWFAAFLSCFTMAFSPLALGKEAEKLSQKNLQQYIHELGLDKKTTLGEFWKKSKIYYPGFVYKNLEKFVEENKNLLMPEVTVTLAKATDGTNVPVLRMNAQGKSTTIQIYGEKNKWAKYNTTVLSEIDLRNVTDVFKRIEASDVHLRREADKIRKNLEEKNKTTFNKKDNSKKLQTFAKDFSRFEGFPRVTPQMWKSITKEQRAGYIIKMRLMWESARQVLDMASEPAQSSSSTIEEFYKNIFGQSAYAIDHAAVAQPNQAQQAKKANVEIRGKTVVTKQGAVVAVPYNAKTCVVAGYIGAYAKVNNVNGKNRDGCSAEVAIASYKQNSDLKFIQEANDQCGLKLGKPSGFACNPLIYGYPKGEELCVDGDSKEFQEATHFNGPCDSGSRLSSSPDIIKFVKKDYSDIVPETKRLEAIEQDQKKEDYKLTTDFLNGMLQKKDPLLKDLFEKGEWSLELDNKLVEIQTQFEEEIRKATDSCRASIANGKNEKNQKQACDQLHRRWLFTEREIAKLRSKACDPGSDKDNGARYIGAYDQDEMISGGKESTLAKTALNKKNIDVKGTFLCECTNVMISTCSEKTLNCPADKMVSKPKRVSFGEKCVLATPEVKPNCPEPLLDVENADATTKYCSCPGKSESVTLEAALQMVAKESDKVCKTQKPDEEKCPGKPRDIEGFDYEKTCDCLKGKLVDENEAGFFSKIFHSDNPKKELKWVCKEASVWPWVLGGLGILALLALYNRSKAAPATLPVPAPAPAPVCNLQCSGNASLNKEACKCTQDPPTQTCAPKQGTYPDCTCPVTNKCVSGQQIYDLSTCLCTDVPQPVVCPDGSVKVGNKCPTCSDGSERSTAMAGRPDGCPLRGEGGSGSNTCAKPPCSGGVPTKN
jgi:hypothetical protein